MQNQYPNNQYQNQQYGIHNQQNYINQPTNYPSSFNNNSELPMKFHIFYSIILLISGGMSILSAIGTFFMEGFAAVGASAILGAVYTLLTGIFLLKKMKAGNIMRLISNICGIVGGAFSILGGFACIIFSAVIEQLFVGTELEGVFAVLGIGISIGVIVGAIIGIIINIIVMRYYSKRKHMF